MKLTPRSIFDPEFDENSVGWCSIKNIDKLYKLDKGYVYVPNNGDLKYIPLLRKATGWGIKANRM